MNLLEILASKGLTVKVVGNKYFGIGVSNCLFRCSILSNLCEIEAIVASLAGFCVLTSALADLPLPQSICNRRD